MGLVQLLANCRQYATVTASGLGQAGRRDDDSGVRSCDSPILK